MNFEMILQYQNGVAELRFSCPTWRRITRCYICEKN